MSNHAAAFEKAKKTGVIAISQTTATILAGYSRLQDALETIVSTMQGRYCDNDTQNEIANRYFGLASPLLDEILREGLADALRDNLSINNFEGI